MKGATLDTLSVVAATNSRNVLSGQTLHAPGGALRMI
jgi:hypothetical protein